MLGTGAHAIVVTVLVIFFFTGKLTIATAQQKSLMLFISWRMILVRRSGGYGSIENRNTQYRQAGCQWVAF